VIITGIDGKPCSCDTRTIFDKVTPTEYNKRFYPFIRQFAVGKIRREEFVYEYGKLQRGNYVGLNTNGRLLSDSGITVSGDYPCAEISTGGKK